MKDSLHHIMDRENEALFDDIIKMCKNEGKNDIFNKADNNLNKIKIQIYNRESFLKVASKMNKKCKNNSNRIVNNKVDPLCMRMNSKSAIKTSQRNRVKSINKHNQYSEGYLFGENHYKLSKEELKAHSSLDFYNTKSLIEYQNNSSPISKFDAEMMRQGLMNNINEIQNLNLSFLRNIKQLPPKNQNSSESFSPISTQTSPFKNSTDNKIQNIENKYFAFQRNQRGLCTPNLFNYVNLVPSPMKTFSSKLMYKTNISDSNKIKESNNRFRFKKRIKKNEVKRIDNTEVMKTLIEDEINKNSPIFHIRSFSDINSLLLNIQSDRLKKFDINQVKFSEKLIEQSSVTNK